MKISCVCVTHGRHWVLNEAVECFIRQQFPYDNIPETELLIVNDCPEQTLVTDFPGIRIINLEKPIQNLLDKFDVAVLEADGDYIAWWEDDDISLPFRLAISAQKIGDAVAYKTGKTFFWNKAMLGPMENFYFGSSLFLRSAYVDNIDKFRDSHCDQAAWARLENAGPVINDVDLPMEEMYWLYRWGGLGLFHDSGAGIETPEGRHAAFRTATLNNPKFQAGEVRLEPSWSMDFEAIVQERIAIVRKETPSNENVCDNTVPERTAGESKQDDSVPESDTEQDG